MCRGNFPNELGPTGNFFLWILFISAGILALLITIYMPYNPHLTITLNILFVLAILGIIFIILDKINLGVYIFIENPQRNAKKEILICLGLFILFFIIPNLRKIIEFVLSTSIFINVENIFTQPFIDTLIATQLNVASETVLINGFAIGMAYYFRRGAGTDNITETQDLKFWIYAIVFTFFLACVFHLGSYFFIPEKLIEEELKDLVGIGFLFTIFTIVGIVRGNILAIYFIHAGWNLGVLCRDLTILSVV